MENRKYHKYSWKEAKERVEMKRFLRRNGIFVPETIETARLEILVQKIKLKEVKS